MKLYTFVLNGAEHVGIGISANQMLDVALAARLQDGENHPEFADMQSLLDAGDRALDFARQLVAEPSAQAIVNMEEVTVIAPLPRPRKIRGGSMYDRHLKQAAEGTARILSVGHPDPEAAYQATKQRLANIPGPGWYEQPAYYLMDATTVIGPDESIAWPTYSDWIDFELEIGAVLGRVVRDGTVEESSASIMGYILVNDLSARDAQLKALTSGMGATGKGKEFDRSICLGPCIVTVDELAEPMKIDFETKINGEKLFRGYPEEQPQWTFAEIIEFVSRAQTLLPGEIVTSGCLPSCCSVEHARKPDRGDTIELEAGPLGVIRTHIIQATEK